VYSRVRSLSLLCTVGYRYYHEGGRNDNDFRVFRFLGFWVYRKVIPVAIRVFMCMKKNIPTVTVLALDHKSNLGLKVRSSRVARYRY
jgi:hypothetical protein